MSLYIFDMDGTLVDSVKSIAYFANKALNKFGMDSIDTERYKILVGDGASILVERMIKEVNGDMNLHSRVLKEYNSTYDNNFLYLANAYEGIVEVLTELKKQGHKTAIVSNKPHNTAQKISDTLFGDRLIDLCFGKKEGYPIKPDPKAVNEVIETLNYHKSDCLYFGDTITDMKTGKNAELYTVGVLWGFRDLEEIKAGSPNKIIKTTKEILDCNL